MHVLCTFCSHSVSINNTHASKKHVHFIHVKYVTLLRMKKHVLMPLMAWMDNIKTWTGLSVEESIRMTENRDKWRKCIHGVANPRIEDGYRTELSCLRKHKDSLCRTSVSNTICWPCEYKTDALYSWKEPS